MEDDPLRFNSSKLLLLLLLLKLLDVEWWSDVDSGWWDCDGKWWWLLTMFEELPLLSDVDIKLLLPPVPALGWWRKFWFGDLGECCWWCSALAGAKPGVVWVCAEFVKWTGWLYVLFTDKCCRLFGFGANCVVGGGTLTLVTVAAGGFGAGRLCCLKGGVGPGWEGVCCTCDCSNQGFSLRLLKRWTLGLGLTAGFDCCDCWVVTVLGWWYCELALFDDVAWWWWWWWPVCNAAVLLFIIYYRCLPSFPALKRTLETFKKKLLYRRRFRFSSSLRFFFPYLFLLCRVLFTLSSEKHENFSDFPSSVVVAVVFTSHERIYKSRNV